MHEVFPNANRFCQSQRSALCPPHIPCNGLPATAETLSGVALSVVFPSKQEAVGNETRVNEITRDSPLRIDANGVRVREPAGSKVVNVPFEVRTKPCVWKREASVYGSPSRRGPRGPRPSQTRTSAIRAFGSSWHSFAHLSCSDGRYVRRAADSAPPTAGTAPK